MDPSSLRIFLTDLEYICYVQTVDPGNPWIALLKKMDPCVICALHVQSMDWTNLAQSVDCTTTRGVCITFMTGHARLDCTVISQNTHDALALSKKNPQKSSEDILLLLLLI